jgi:diacylglycerol kinase
MRSRWMRSSLSGGVLRERVFVPFGRQKAHLASGSEVTSVVIYQKPACKRVFACLQAKGYTYGMFDEPAKERQAFSIVNRAKSFRHAFRGIFVIYKTQPNFWFHTLSAAVTIFLGFFLHVSETEWLALVFAIGFVVVSEAWNTAVEFDIDLTSPQMHPFARDTKDVAAAAVLISALTSIIIGLIIFLPKILALLK